MQSLQTSFARIVKVVAGIIPLMFALFASAAIVDEPILIDFGRHDGGNGAVTINPDSYNNYWNSWSGGAGTIAINAVFTNIVTAANHTSTVSVTATTSTWQNNGYVSGGLLSPNPALLGEYAVATATGDYYYNQSSGTLRLAGLDPSRQYKLSMFATRDTATVRTTRYSVTDVNGAHTVDLQTSGAGSGSGVVGFPTGNDDTIVELDNLVPSASGQLDLVVSVVTGGFAYIGVLKITPLNPPLTFIKSVRSIEVASGTSTSLVANAASSLPINYQWYFTNSPIPNATDSSLSLPSVSAANVGNYFVTISNANGYETSSVASVTIGPDHLPDYSVLVDFSRNNLIDGHDTASPDANGRYWNNLGTNSATFATGAAVSNLVTVNNSNTTFSVTLLTNIFQCNGRQNGGLLAPHYALLGDFANTSASEDYIFLNNGLAGISGTIRIAGLNPATSYKLRMFATRETDAGTTRTTRYSVTDTNGVHTITLQTSGPGAGSGSYGVTYGNDKAIVSLNGLVPNASGQLDLVVSEVAGLFAYLGILEITLADPVPSFVLQPQTVEVAPGTSTSMVAYAISPQPLSYQWYFTNSPISGATSTNLSLPSVSAANVGSYFLVASNSFGVVTSSVASVILGPDHLPNTSVLVDFGRHDGGANGAVTPSPDANGHYWNNIGTSAMAVPQDLAISNLVTLNNTATTIGVTVVSDNFQCNGTQNGGLLTPHYGILGDFAIATATEDYFFVNNGSPGITGTLRVFGLSPTRKYNFSMFATRTTADTRTSRYSVSDINGLHSVDLQTSGTNAGTGVLTGNDDTIVSLTELVPNGAGELELSVTEVNGLYAYLGILQIIPTNSAPIVSNFSIGAASGVPATVQVIGGKYAPTDGDGDPLVVSQVGPAANGTVSTDGTNITYTPGGSFTGGDSFTYTVSDGQGGSTSGTISVSVVSNGPGFNQIGLPVAIGGGKYELTFLGLPGDNYALQVTHDLTPPVLWTSLVTNTVATNGYLRFTNTPSLPLTNDFFRTSYVP